MRGAPALAASPRLEPGSTAVSPVCSEASRRRLRRPEARRCPSLRARSALGDVSSRRLRCPPPPPARPGPGLRLAAGACEGRQVLRACRMEESMEEEEGGSYEAMMDDQNHNNWEAAVEGFQAASATLAFDPSPCPRDSRGQLLAMPAVSVDRKGPQGGLPMGPPPPPPEGYWGDHDVEERRRGRLRGQGGPRPPRLHHQHQHLHLKFCESSPSPAALAFPPPHGDARSVPLGQPFFFVSGPGLPLPGVPASLRPSLPGLVSVGRRRSGPGSLYYPGL